MKYHLSADGKIRPCRAKGSPPFGSGFSGEKGSSGRAYIEGRKAEENRYSKALENKIPYSQEEAEERGRIVNETMNKLISGGFTTQRLHSENGVYKPERQKLHEEILTEFEEKYKHIPSENKVIFSAGLPGAGKTTIAKALGTEVKDLMKVNETNEPLEVVFIGELTNRKSKRAFESVLFAIEDYVTMKQVD